MSDKLHQINVQYSNVEDRILLRASTENDDEYLFWLTRRFTRLLLGILGREIEQRGGAAGDGNLILEIQSEAGQGIVFNLNDTLLYMFYSLLTQGVTQTEWQLDPFPEGSRQQLH